MELHVGTSGYSYKEWKGPFYPEKLPAAQMLSYYAERLSCVEINNTFYRMPKTSVVENWAQQVPEGFKFSIKASRRITHFKRLKEADGVTELEGGARALGQQLEEGLEARHVDAELGRQLEQDHAEPVAQHLHGAQQVAGLGVGLLQALEMRDATRGLDREAEALG